MEGGITVSLRLNLQYKIKNNRILMNERHFLCYNNTIVIVICKQNSRKESECYGFF